MAESKYYSTLQKVYAAPNLAADIWTLVHSVLVFSRFPR
jgi:hypothetical protein